MKFFDELKRRNVVRVASAYVVVAWLVLQFADIILAHIDVPDWVFVAILLILGGGLIFAVLLSWIFELTPEGIKREHEVDRSKSITYQTGKKLDRITIVVLIIAVSYFAIDKYVLTDNPAIDELVLADLGEKSIAVLPLANRSAREEDQYFVDGMHDDLLTQLARVSSLKVISRTSVMRYRDTEIPIPKIAAQLNVGTILEGGVQRAGDQIRVNVQLIEAETDEHIWAEIYDRQMTAENLFDIQSEITNQIVDALETTLTRQEVVRIENRRTDNLEAFDEQMRGQQQLVTRTVPGIEQGKTHFERALELDPNYLDAIVGLANAYHLLNEYAGWPGAESLDPAMDLVNRALQQDPEMAEAYMVRGELYRHYREFDRATADFERAMNLMPGNATLYHWFSFVKSQQNNLQDAHKLLRRAHELNPMNPVIHANYAIQPFYLGRDEESLAELQRVKQVHPENPFVWSMESRVYRAHGDVVSALRSSRRVAEIDPDGNRAMGVCFQLINLAANDAAVDCIENTLVSNALARAMVQTVVYAIEGNGDAAAAEFDAILEAEDRIADRVELGGDTEYRIEFLGYSAIAAGRYDDARTLYEKHYEDWFSQNDAIELNGEQLGDALDTAFVLANSGDGNRAETLLQATLETMSNLHRNRGLHAYGFKDVQAHALLGNTDEALASLEACAQVSYLSEWQGLKYLPHYDSIRGDPRFHAALDSLRAAAEVARARAEAEQLL